MTEFKKTILRLKHKARQLQILIGSYLVKPLSIKIILKFIWSNKLLVFVSLMIILSFLPTANFLNIIAIKDINIANSVLSVIIGSLSSILAILIAVLLVAFEILRRIYTVYTMRTFLRQKSVLTIFILYIVSILYTLIILAKLTNTLPSININIAIILFGLCIITIYPYSRKIILSARSTLNVYEIVEKIDSKHAIIFKSPNDYIPLTNYLTQIEDNPIYILNEAAIRSLNEDDRLTSKVILVTMTSKLCEYIGSYCRDIINGFLTVFNTIAFRAIKLHDNNLIIMVFDMLRNIQYETARKQLPWHDTIEFNECIGEIMNETVINGLNEACKHGFYLLEDIMGNNIKYNCPKEEDLWILNKDKMTQLKSEDHDKSLQWNYSVDPFLRIMDSVVEKAIDLRNYVVVANAMSSLKHFMQQVISDELKNKLGEKQKAFILRQCCYYGNLWSNKSIEVSLWLKIIPFSPYDSFLINRALEASQDYSKLLLINFSYILLLLAKQKSLDEFSLNEFGTIGRTAVDKINKDKIYKEAVFFILSVFRKIRDISSQPDDQDAREIYLETYRQVESIKRWMEQNKQNIESSLWIEVERDLVNFTLLPKCQEKQGSELVEWPKL